MSERVVTAVADAEGVTPTALVPPLYEAIDPDALDALCRGSVAEGSTTVRVQFSYDGYRVTVEGPDAVTVEPDEPDEELVDPA